MVTYDSIISNSHVVLPTGIVDKNIVIDQGKIVKLTNETPQCDHRIDGSGLISIPGLIDPHVHYGVYSPIDKAAESESKVAASAGITTMMRMLRLGGSYKKNLQSHLEASSNTHYVDYTIHASILEKNQIEEMDYIKTKGIDSFKLYMNLGEDLGHVYMDMEPGKNFLQEQKVEMDYEMVEKIISKAGSLGSPVLVHAEDFQMCSCGIREAKEKNRDGLRAWSESRSSDSEVKAIQTVSRLAKKFECLLYFVHIGSSRAINAIRDEKMNGTKIFVETCPHYLSLSYDYMEGYLAKVMPPIRSSSDVESIWNEVSSGHIDSMGTDHVANRLSLKLSGSTIWDALAGFPGMGTLLPILLSRGVEKSRISLEQLVQITSLNSSKIFGMFPKKGILQAGSDADIILVDLKKERKVSSEIFGGFSDYSVYDGWILKGWPLKTLLRGETIAEDFQVVGKKGYGEFISRPVSI